MTIHYRGVIGAYVFMLVPTSQTCNTDDNKL